VGGVVADYTEHDVRWDAGYGVVRLGVGDRLVCGDVTVEGPAIVGLSKRPEGGYRLRWVEDT
jgi:hypothetical protein